MACAKLLPGLLNGFETDYALGLANKGKAINLDGLAEQEMDLVALDQTYSSKFELDLSETIH
jgi:hypothetical protein